MKKETTRISRLIEQLQEIQKEAGDAKVYVIHSNDGIEIGNSFEFNGLSDSLAMFAVAMNNEKGVMIFQSDEILKP